MTIVRLKQLTLGDMIDSLAVIDQTAHLRFAFGLFEVGELASYRGYYDELALSFESDTRGKPVRTVGEVKVMLEAAVGKTFTGWKGGEFLMNRATPLWAARRGEAWQACIVGITEDGATALIETASAQWVGR